MAKRNPLVDFIVAVILTAVTAAIAYAVSEVGKQAGKGAVDAINEAVYGKSPAQVFQEAVKGTDYEVKDDNGP